MNFESFIDEERTNQSSNGRPGRQRSRSPTLKYDEFSRGGKGPRTESSPKLILLCSCCDRPIDLRTVHCDDCCDSNRKRRNHWQPTDRNRARGDGTRRPSSNHSPTSPGSAAGVSSSSSASHRSHPSSSLRFVPEGFRQRERSDRSDRRLRAEESLDLISTEGEHHTHSHFSAAAEAFEQQHRLRGAPQSLHPYATISTASAYAADDEDLVDLSVGPSASQPES